MTLEISVDSARIDQWLWAVRLYRTRSLATSACRAGHVRVNDKAAKAATPVRIGDRVRIRGNGDERHFEVVRLLTKRVGAPEAALCHIDHTPRPVIDEMVQAAAFAVRDRGSGKPTKRERRQLDRLRGRD